MLNALVSLLKEKLYITALNFDILKRVTNFDFNKYCEF